MINGIQIKKETTIATKVTIGARQSAPVAKKDIKSGGVTQATCCETGFTKPNTVAKYPIPTEITGVKTKGINKIGFKTTGNPNRIGSLILKIPGPIDSFATVWYSSRFEKNKIAKTITIVPPEPPNQAYASKEPRTQV